MSSLNLSTYAIGFMTGLSLIMAIGAQNAFVLRQGIKRQQVFLVCFVCALSDALLIGLGVFGFARIIEQHPVILMAAKYLGALFLFGYGAKSFYDARYASKSLTDTQSAAATLGVCLALTWLNPHVYLDTVVLMGSIASQFEDRLAFALGGMSASWVFFFSLGYGARLLAPWFARPQTWRYLDVAIGIIMWLIAIKLLS